MSGIEQGIGHEHERGKQVETTLYDLLGNPKHDTNLGFSNASLTISTYQTGGDHVYTAFVNRPVVDDLAVLLWELSQAPNLNATTITSTCSSNWNYKDAEDPRTKYSEGVIQRFEEERSTLINSVRRRNLIGDMTALCLTSEQARLLYISGVNAYKFALAGTDGSRKNAAIAFASKIIRSDGGIPRRHGITQLINKLNSKTIRTYLDSLGLEERDEAIRNYMQGMQDALVIQATTGEKGYVIKSGRLEATRDPSITKFLIGDGHIAGEIVYSDGEFMVYPRQGAVVLMPFLKWRKKMNGEREWIGSVPAFSNTLDVVSPRNPKVKISYPANSVHQSQLLGWHLLESYSESRRQWLEEYKDKHGELFNRYQEIPYRVIERSDKYLQEIPIMLMEQAVG